MEEEERDFFQNASHELKSPLTSIIGYQQMICDDIVDSKDQIINYSSKTLKEAKRIHPSSEGLRIMGNGDIKTSVNVKANYVTPAAKAKIEAAGGKVELV